MNSRPIYQHEYDNARRLQIEMQESALAANKAMIEMNNRHRNYLNQHPKIEIRREVETQYHVIENSSILRKHLRRKDTPRKRTNANLERKRSDKKTNY